MRSFFELVSQAFTDILGPVEVSISFELIPIGVEVATTTFPGDGPPTDNRILISLSSLWVGYTPLVDIAAGIILLKVRTASVDGRFFEFDLAPLEIGIPTMAQLQSYLDNYFAYPDGDFFRALALGDTQAAFNVAIFASAIVGRLANEGEDTLEVFDKLMEALSHVEINDEVSINGVSLTILLASGVPEMVSGESQVVAAGLLKAAFEKTKELAGNLEKTSVGVINKLSAFMFSGSVNMMLASSTLAEKEHLEEKTYSTNLLLSQNATTTCFEGFDILDDIYLTKLMPEFEDPEIYADITMSKMHLRIKRENRTRYSERVYLVGGDSDSLVRTTSFSDLLGNSCWGSPEVGIQFLEANFNPFEYSNNSHQIRSDVTGLGVKCGTRTHDVSGLSEPIDILTRRKNESLDGSIYVFETTEPLGSLAIFQFFAGKEQSALGFNIDVNSTLFPQTISLFLRKDGLPTQDVFNWTATLPLPEDQLFSIPWTDQAPWSNETNLASSAYQWLLPREEVNITDYDVGNMTAYFIGVQFGTDQDLGDGELISFTLTVHESSCVYFDEDIHLWQTDGCEVGLLTNMTHIHCRCDHLTKFAGFVPPNPLNIAEALSANVLENPAGLVLVLTVFASYLFGILLTRKADRRDLQKAGVGLLPGHIMNPRKECQYVITVYTGFRGNAGTTAQVTVALNGFKNESVPFKLRDQQRVLFEKGSVDSFLVSTEEPIGELTHLRVWHNNGGYSPGWFLSQIVVTNIATNNTTYFLCNRWLSVDEDDGKVHRIIPTALPEDLKKFRNLFLAKSSRDINDGHLWFSVVGRPARSPFTRVQRLSCCLTLLYSTMLTNIMFFGRGDEFDPPEPLMFGGTEINIPVSLPQIMIGIQSAAIILPVNILIVFLFRNTGPQVTNKAQTEDHGKKKSSLPWWAVYIGWLLVWSASFVAAFFTVLYTLSFGRAKAEAWLVTFLTSFVTDLFLMQPFKLLIVAVIFAMVSKPLTVQSLTSQIALMRDYFLVS
ncbi:polycystin-1-like protein 2 [Branchiostoma floridae x Branchiostoma japonicum]